MDAARSVVTLSEYATNTINYKSLQLIGSYGITESDLDDMRQDLKIDLFERLLGYDSRRAKVETFISRVINNKIASSIETRTCKARDYRKCWHSLNQHVQTDNGTFIELGDLIAANDGDFDAIDLKIDIHRALSKLTNEQKRLCKVLSKYDKTCAAQIMGISRAKLYNLRKIIHAIFEECGLSEYIQNTHT